MSTTIFDRFQDPIFAGATVLFIVISVVLHYIMDTWVAPIFIGLLVSGGLYILYQDYVEKQRIKLAEEAKEQDLDRRKAEQAAAEGEKGKCISCLSELPANAEKCPNCGFAVKHYSVD